MNFKVYKSNEQYIFFTVVILYQSVTLYHAQTRCLANMKYRLMIYDM